MGLKMISLDTAILIKDVLGFALGIATVVSAFYVVENL